MQVMASASGACTYFGQNGEFSSGPSTCPKGFAQGSGATTSSTEQQISTTTASFYYVHSTTPVYYVRDYLKIRSLHHFYYIEQHFNSRNNLVQRHNNFHDNLHNFVVPVVYC
ncbi:hypothetical protein C8J55DRAFT_323942 [Lentinula edodes]|uniref:Uncharacterized protein n=1 Tax=Lentinula lateritia TaxID=40482 RepID=A0A9W9DUU6_9AGAR|nr:hypothetical protein C8J55DRAFT_323942 [Lentinula edodes]